MRNFKLTRGIQIILGMLFVLIVGIISVGIFSNEKSLAGSTCSICFQGTLTLQKIDSSQHGYYCSYCDSYYNKSNHSYTNGECACGATQSHSHSYSTSYTNNGDGTHTPKYTCSCGSSYNGAAVAHTYTSGKCVCDATDSSTCSICFQGTLTLQKIDSSQHGYYCSYCDSYYNKASHSYTNGTCACGATQSSGSTCSICFQGTLTLQKIDSSQHGYYCSYCDSYYNKESHSYTDGTCACGATQLSGSTCSVCFQGTLVGPINIDSDQHGYYCSYCDSYYNKESHSYTDGTCACGATQSSDGGGSGSGGTDTSCSHTYVTKNDENLHWQVCSKCGEEYSGSKEGHLGGTHDNEGKCTYEGCGYQYQTHSQSTTIKDYTKTETTHTPVYECSFEGCTSIYDGTEEEHKGATHENDGKCTVEGCGYQYETHGKSETVKEYKKTENGHIPVYTCTFTDCEGTHEGEEETHTGATHENGGKCTACEEIYQNHEKSATIKEYKTTETTHIPVYACTFEGCTGGYEVAEEAEAHTGATHENAGTCTVCDEIYEEHGKSSTVKEYKKTEEGHTPVYGCKHEGCTATYDGETENHTVEQWSDNENGTHSGNCKVCSYTKTEEHNYEDGKCDKCNATEPTEDKTCEHTYVLKNNETQHWEECSKCEEVKSGTLESHQYDNYVDNEDGTHSATCTECEYKFTEEHNYEDGKCAECDSTEPSEEETCEHSYVTKNDETHHWEECTKCEGIKAGSKEEHEYKTYTDNKDGTHSATCTGCDYELTEKHNYEDEKCSECDSIEPSDDDDNDNNNNNNDDENNNSNTDSSNANKDNSTAGKEIPKAGIESTIVIIIIALGAVLGISVFKMNKYKDI